MHLLNKLNHHDRLHRLQEVEIEKHSYIDESIDLDDKIIQEE
jgi:hypothetical protein